MIFTSKSSGDSPYPTSGFVPFKFTITMEGINGARMLDYAWSIWNLKSNCQLITEKAVNEFCILCMTLHKVLIFAFEPFCQHANIVVRFAIFYLVSNKTISESEMEPELGSI